MVTLREIAVAAGVSIRTVTRALQDAPGGNAATYRRVRALARRLGYVPNVAARNLKTRRTNMVGIVASPADYEIGNRKTLALQRLLEQHGRYSVSGILPETATAARQMLRDWAGIVEAVVFLAWRDAWQPERILAETGVRSIFVDCLTEPLATGRTVVALDRFRGIQTGVEELIRAGHRRIVRCGNMANRAAGFAQAFAACGRKLSPQDHYPTPNIFFADGYRLGRRLMQDAVDAAFFDSDAMALGFLKFAYEQRVAIPGNIAVIGFDDLAAAAHACPALSTVAHPIDEMAEAIFNLLAPDAITPATVVLPTRFIRRESS